MTEEAVAVESKADAETQAKAEKLGWIPPERFKGDPERFVDADAYIERGEIAPLLAGIFPLERIADAQREFMRKRHVGNLVLIP